MHPDDLPKIADFLGLSIQETINKYLIWNNNTLLENSEDKFYLRPMTKKETKDKDNIYAFFLASGSCIFLNEKTNLCKIHPVIPRGGKMWSCAMEINDENRKIVYIKEYAYYDWVNHPLYPKLN